MVYCQLVSCLQLSTYPVLTGQMTRSNILGKQWQYRGCWYPGSRCGNKWGYWMGIFLSSLTVTLNNLNRFSVEDRLQMCFVFSQIKSACEGFTHYGIAMYLSGYRLHNASATPSFLWHLLYVWFVSTFNGFHKQVRPGPLLLTQKFARPAWLRHG